jgi:hypothetical protein
VPGAQRYLKSEGKMANNHEVEWTRGSKIYGIIFVTICAIVISLALLSLYCPPLANFFSLTNTWLTQTQGPEYVISETVPGKVILITAPRRINEKEHDTYRLNSGVAEISKKYNILKITSISETEGFGTTSLMITVEPK